MKKLTKKVARRPSLDIFDDSVAELCDELASAWAKTATKLQSAKEAGRTAISSPAVRQTLRG